MKSARGVRLLGGEYRGRVLRVPPSARPSEGRLREALFSIWSEELAGAEVLDLFAGSGAVGIEAIGRGALGAVLVERDRRSQQTIVANLAAMGLGPPRVRLLERSVESALAELLTAGERFDLIFADPPYAWTPTEAFVGASGRLLGPGGALALEHSARVAVPAQAGALIRVDTRRYGESALSLFRSA